MNEVKENYLQRLANLVEPVSDAAEMLGVSRQYVLTLVASGKLESVKLGKGSRAQIYVSSLSLQELLDARSQRPRKSKAQDLSKGAVTMQP